MPSKTEKEKAKAKARRMMWQQAIWIGWAVIILGFLLANFSLILINHNEDDCCGGPVVQESTVDDDALAILKGPPTAITGVMGICLESCRVCVNDNNINATEALTLTLGACARSCACCQSIAVCENRPSGGLGGGICVGGTFCQESSIETCRFPPTNSICEAKGF